jgi:hypothetical protein
VDVDHDLDRRADPVELVAGDPTPPVKVQPGQSIGLPWSRRPHQAKDLAAQRQTVLDDVLATGLTQVIVTVLPSPAPPTP